MIDEEDGGGGTELTSALRDAIAIPRDKNISRSVVVITDGYIFDEKATFDLISKNLDTTSFFSFGIGSSVSRYLIDGIAKAGQGEAFVVTDPDEAEETAKRFRTYIQAPILTDIHVTYDGFDTYDMEPSKLPTLFAERPIVLFGKWRGEPTGTIKITGKTGSQDYVKEIAVSDVQPLDTNNALPYLWARTKVENLTDYGNNNADEEAVKKEVTALGLKYSMMTPYTSFIAVTDIVRNKDGDSKDVKQPLPLPEGVSNLAVGGYTNGSEPGEIILVGGIIFLILLNLICRAIRRTHGGGDLSTCEPEKNNAPKGGISMTAPEIKSFIKQNWIFYLFGFAAIFGIKYFYSRADCSDLLWILTPTAWWVRVLGGIPFEYIPDIGFVNHGLRFIIAPSCSGVQFMIITMAALLYSFVHRMGTMRRKLGWILLCLGCSYFFTIFVNGIRIVFAIYIPLYCYRPGHRTGWLTPDRLHTVIGVVIYFTSLFVVCQIAGYVTQRDAAPSQKAIAPLNPPTPAGTLRHLLSRCIPPMFWYFSIVLGIPLLNRAYRQNWSQFIEYATLMILVCSGLVSLFCLTALIRKRVCGRTR